MGDLGYGSAVDIYRLRTQYAIAFDLYLDGRFSAEDIWSDRGDEDIEVTNNSAPVAAYGYKAAGAGDLSGDLGLTADGRATFTLAAVVTRNAHTGNDVICAGMLGDGEYARLRFSGTDLIAEVRLDGSVITLTVANVGTYILPGKPAFIVLRGDAAAGTELYIDNTLRASSATTGTEYNTGTDGFTLLYSAGLSQRYNGELRGVFLTADKLTSAQLTAWRSMLEHEGFFDGLRDDLLAWTAARTVIPTTAGAFGDTPYQVTREAGLTAYSGIEEKESRQAAYIKIEGATSAAAAYLSLALGAGVKTITGAQAKTLPAVVAGEIINVYAELYASSISGSRVVQLEIDFYDESGAQIGTTLAISAARAGEWYPGHKRVTVPASATRINVALRASCASGETVSAWLANASIRR